DLPDHFDQLRRRGGFQEIAASPGRERSLYLDVPFEGRQHDDPRLGELADDRADDVDSAAVRHPEIHKRDVRTMLPEQLDGFASARRLGHHFHVVLVVDDGGEAFAQERMIVDAEYPDLAHDGFSTLSSSTRRAHRNRFAVQDRRRPGAARSKASPAGTLSSTSVPAPARLRIFSVAPMRSARSRMPVRPQCPSRPPWTTCSPIPLPSSLTNIRSSAGVYSSSISIRVADECRKALSRASRPIR